jgi:hypothetical protein
MSRSSIKRKSRQLHSYPITIVSRNTTFRRHKNRAPCRPLKCPQAENCRTKLGCSRTVGSVRFGQLVRTLPSRWLESYTVTANSLPRAHSNALAITAAELMYQR